MTETVLALPVLLVILMFLVYFGRGLVRVQSAQVADRYEAWRRAEHAPGPYAIDLDDSDENPVFNSAFFGGNAERIEADIRDDYPVDAAVALGAVAGATSPDAGDLAYAALLGLPRGRTVELSVEHANTVPIWERFEGPIVHTHTRVGNNWRFANGWSSEGEPASPYAGHESSVRDVFLEDLDQTLANVEDDANTLAMRIRQLYLRPPNGGVYVGPTIERE